MKHPFHSHILPFFTMGAGGLGLALRIWLFSNTDEKGLLPAGHFADYALYILTALTLGILYLSTANLTRRRINKNLTRLLGVGGYAAGGLGLIFTAFTQLSSGSAKLAWLAVAASILGALAMFLMAALKFARKRLPYWLPAILTIVLMLDTVAQCQVWGAVPQLQAYFFPLLASIFLILSAYSKTTFAAKQGNPRRLAFFSQSALFFCCLSLNAPQWPLYLGMLFWAAAQLLPCVLMKKEV
ncbi:MAG: hypothetical protein IKB09_12890 [Oscillospiraceae bacterium]|nr:hypothetical protein [Oscillospiraceae bacterium]